MNQIKIESSVEDMSNPNFTHAPKIPIQRDCEMCQFD